MLNGLSAALLLVAAVLATTATAAPGAACGFCGKNLIKNPGAEAGAGDHRRRGVRRSSGLDERGGPVRRRVVHLPQRVVREDVEGLAQAGQELLLRRHDHRGRLREGHDRQADDQAACGGVGSQGDARRLARQLRNGADREHDSGAGGVRRRGRHRAGTTPDRERHDDLGHGHGVPAAGRAAVPRGATQVTIVVTFASGNNYKLAGADDLLVLA